ncbi:hypothetical protein GIB67_020089 [Kingdonia uniflora]|uniref:Transmembrane protein n=1 Tax=Kingdonia uniflora TaxID=39325 RepID=A0A7J7L2H4_9MAGN|nr:hypothetical protein GIB67_020089 [Kingdonia uniflora]
MVSESKREDVNHNSTTTSTPSSSSSWPNSTSRQVKEEDNMRLWGILLFGLIGATATTYAVGQLRRTVDWFYIQRAMLLESEAGTGNDTRNGNGKRLLFSLHDSGNEKQETYDNNMRQLKRNVKRSRKRV